MKASNLFRTILERDEAHELGVKPDYKAENKPDAGGLDALEKSYQQYKEELGDVELEPERKLEIAEDILGEIDFSSWALNVIIRDLSKKENNIDPDLFISGAINQIGEHAIPATLTTELSNLKGVNGIGFKNRANLKIEKEDGPYYTSTNSLNILNNCESGTLIFDGDITEEDEIFIGEEMNGGTVRIKGDVHHSYWGTPNSMNGGECYIEGSAYRPGLDMEKGFVQVKEEARQPGARMKGGEIGIKDSAEEIGREMKGGIAWTEGNVEKAGYEAEGGTIYISGDAHIVGQNSEAGEIYVEGEISEIGENCNAEVYTWKDYKWNEAEVG